jgi:hypothetical protein
VRGVDVTASEGVGRRKKGVKKEVYMYRYV